MPLSGVKFSRQVTRLPSLPFLGLFHGTTFRSAETNVVQFTLSYGPSAESTQLMMAPTILTVVVTVLDIPALVFQGSMVCFLVAQIQRRSSLYNQGFFIVYTAVSVVDCVYVIDVREKVPPN